MRSAQLDQLLTKSKILVIGDLILDIHREGEKLGLSAETPTIVVKDRINRISYGGAGLLVRNILNLGGKVNFISLAGSDELARNIGSWSHPNLRIHCFQESGRVTTAKERFWVDGCKLLQWDHLDNHPVSKATEKSIISFVRKDLANFDKLIISDYRHGLLTQSFAAILIGEAKKQKKPIYVDSQVSQNQANHYWYAGASLVCLNEREAMSVDPDFKISTTQGSLKQLSRKLKIKNIVLKLGANGSACLLNGRYIRTSGIKVKAVDTVGAGDAFLALLAVAGELSPATLKLANLWAALATTIRGPEPASLEMLDKNLNKI